MLAPHGPGSIKEQAVRDEIKKPEEIVESVETPSPEPPRVMSESDLEQMVGGVK